MWSEGIARPITRSKRSVQVTIARKVHAAQGQKKNLDGFYEILAPRSTVGKISRTKIVIKETNRPEICVKNSDIDKFATRNERYAELGQYIERRSKKVQEKTLEQKIVKHKKDLIRKDSGSKKIKRNRKQTDDVSVISSGRSCISTSSNVARALKMRIPKCNPKHDNLFINRPDLTQILHFNPPVPIVAPPTQPDTAIPSAPQLTPSA